MERSDERSTCDKRPTIKTVDNNHTCDDMDVLKSNTDIEMFKPKYDVDDDDKCVNNQDNCNNLKNANTNTNQTDCNVVIDDDIQLKEQVELTPPPSLLLSQQPSTYGCKHYKRKAKFVVS